MNKCLTPSNNEYCVSLKHILSDNKGHHPLEYFNWITRNDGRSIKKNNTGNRMAESGGTLRSQKSQVEVLMQIWLAISWIKGDPKHLLHTDHHDEPCKCRAETDIASLPQTYNRGDKFQLGIHSSEFQRTDHVSTLHKMSHSLINCSGLCSIKSPFPL